MTAALYAAGSNAHGQLANGSRDDAHIFTPCQFSTKPSAAEVLSVACGGNHTLLLLKDSESGHTSIWGAGDSSQGQLGNNASSTVFTPVQLQLPDFARDFQPDLIAASWEASYISLRGPEFDVLVSFGSNTFGDLGRIAENNVWTVDLCRPDERVRILSLASSFRTTLALVTCQTFHGEVIRVLGWGASRQGQLGIIQPVVPSPIILRESSSAEGDRVIGISCGSQHTLLLRADGHVDALGSDRKEQLGDISKLDAIKNVQTTWNASFALSSKGIAHAYGRGDHGQLASEASSSTYNHIQLEQQVTEIICGSEHVLVRTEDGSCWGWGWNEHGNLGLNHTENVVKPIGINQPSIFAGRPTGIWAGCATTWLAFT